MSGMQLTIKRFDESIHDRGIGWTGQGQSGIEFRIYHLCDGARHWRCSVPIGRNPRQSWPGAESVGACDKLDCADGYEVRPRDLPWSIQDKLGFRCTVSEGYVLVHQRYHHDGSPYFKIFGPRSEFCPAMAEDGIFMPAGSQTIVLKKDRKTNELKALKVTNHIGRPYSIDFVAKVVEIAHHLKK